MKRTIIVGGGISGLVAAYRLLQSGGAEVVLLEASDRLGGNIRTSRSEGLLLDGGPDSWVASKPQATALCRELGLGDRLVGTQSENRRVYVSRGGKLIPMPEGLVLGLPTRIRPFLETKLLSPQAKARVLAETLFQKGPEGDPSIMAFLEERFGREMAEVVLEPLLGGVYSGDGNALSLKAAFPQLAEMAQKHGSLVRAMRAMGRARASSKPSSNAPTSPFLTLRGGMGELVEALTRAIGEDVIRLGAKVASVQEGEGGFEVRLEGGESLYGEHVIIAAPAHAASRMLAPLDHDLSHELYGIPYVSTATVTLAYKRGDIAHPLDATGYLVPVRERKHVMAGTFVSSKWPERAEPGTGLLRAFVGGGHDPEVLENDDAKIVRLVRGEIEPLLSIRGEPLLERVVRFDRASPQPVVGHLARMERIAARLRMHPGLFVIGNAYEGIGIPDCVRHAENAAKAILNDAG